jgi:hypothetical protein
MIPSLAVSPTLAPNPAPLGVLLEVEITPSSSGGVLPIISGANIVGNSATYGDLYAMSAYNGRTGHDTRGGTRGALRVARGNSDTKGRRVR